MGEPGPGVEHTQGALVGRLDELATIDAALAAAETGRGGLVLLVGEPGIGKTRLAEEAAARAATRGFAVAWGRAWEQGGAPAFWPWIEVLRALGDEVAAAALGGAGGGGGEADRFARSDAVAGALRGAATRAPLLVVLDDLHAADPSSLGVAELVARGVADTRLVLLGSHRDADARRRPEIAASLARLGRRAQTLLLPRLGRAETRALVAGVAGAGADDEETARMVHDASEGNPLFVRELVRLVAARGAQAARGSVPDGVRAVIRERLAALSPATVALLGAAAAVGRELSIPVAAEVAGVTAEALEEAVAEAVEADLLVPAGPHRARFSHVLVAETLLADLPATRRARLHRRAAEALERRHAGDPAPPLDEIAHHWLAAGSDAAPEALRAAERAGRAALARLAFEAAALRFEEAETALATAAPGDGTRRAELLLGRAEAHLRAGDAARGRDAARAAFELARTLGDPALRVRAALVMGLEVLTAQVDGELVAALAEAEAALPPGDGAWRALALARLAAAEQPAADPAGPAARARGAIAMARRLGDPALLLPVLHSAVGALMEYAPPAERIGLNQEVARLAAAAGDRPRELRASQRLAYDHAEIGDAAGFRAALDAYARLVRAFAQPRLDATLALLESMQSWWRGDFAEAARFEAEVALLAERAGDEELARSLVYRRVLVADLLGDGEAVAAALPPMLVMVRAYPVLERLLRLWNAALGGEHALARAELDRVTAAEAAMIGGDPGFACMVLEAAERAGHAGVAALVRPYLGGLGGRFVVATGLGSLVYSAGDHALLRAAALCGDFAAADAHAAAALALIDRLGAPPLRAWVEWSWARSFVARGEPSRAAELAARARATAERLGMPGLAALAAAVVAPGCEAAAAPPGVAVAAPAAAPASAPAITLRQAGELWIVEGGGERALLKDSRGVRMLARLVAEPGREVAAIDLVGDGAAPGEAGAGAAAIDLGDAGEVLDARARAAYQTRLGELRAELAEAQAWNDAGRAAGLRAEAEAIAGELAAGVGLGGRERRAGSAAERARVNAQRRLADAIKRVAEHCPALGRHLAATVRTGTFCCYVPDAPRAVRGGG